MKNQKSEVRSQRSVLLIAIACLALSGCASTKVYNAGGKKALDLQANAGYVKFQQGTLRLEMWDVDHSTPTLAGGQAFALGMDSTGRLLTNAALALGSGGGSKAAGSGSAAAFSLLNRPASVPALPATYRTR